MSEYLKAERAKKLEAEKKRTAQKAEQKRQHELDREVYQRESDAYLDSIDFSEADHEMLGIKSPNKRKAEKQAEEGSDQVPDEFSDEDVEHQHYCVACRKRFKSEKQWQNHEKSKKHKENVALLRTELLLDEEIEQFLEDQHELDEQLHSIQHQAEETPEPMPASAAPEDVDEEGLDENDPNVAELLSKFKLTSLNQQEKPADAEAPAAAAAAPATATQADDDDDEEPSAPVHKTVESDQEHSDDGVDEDFFLQSMLSKAKQKKQNKQAKKAQQRNAFAALMEEHKQGSNPGWHGSPKFPRRTNLTLTFTRQTWRNSHLFPLPRSLKTMMMMRRRKMRRMRSRAKLLRRQRKRAQRLSPSLLPPRRNKTKRDRRNGVERTNQARPLPPLRPLSPLAECAALYLLLVMSCSSIYKKLATQRPNNVNKLNTRRSMSVFWSAALR